MAEKPRMLEGYRVLDFTQFVAGPTCTRILAEMGAEVIKVEPAPEGDRARTFGLRRNGTSTYFFQHNHSKRSLAIDTHHPKAKAIFHELVRKSDVLVENYAPGVIGRIGVDWDTVKAINPRMVMASISMAGQTGPLAFKGGYDFIGQAYAGVTDLVGEPDRPPAMLSLALGDISTGVTTAMAIGFALLYRNDHRRGPVHRRLAARQLLPYARARRAGTVAAARQVPAQAQRPDVSALFTLRDFLRHRRVRDDLRHAPSMARRVPRDGKAGADQRSALQGRAPASQKSRRADRRSSRDGSRDFQAWRPLWRHWTRSACHARRCSPCRKP